MKSIWKKKGNDGIIKTKTIKESIEIYGILQTITRNDNIKEKQFKSTKNITDEKHRHEFTEDTPRKKKNISWEQVNQFKLYEDED